MPSFYDQFVWTVKNSTVNSVYKSTSQKSLSVIKGLLFFVNRQLLNGISETGHWIKWFIGRQPHLRKRNWLDQSSIKNDLLYILCIYLHM